MLPKKNRLTVAEFNLNPQKSKEVQERHFLLKIKSELSSRYPRFIIIVPTFLDKRSSYRHLTKRITEEVIRAKIKRIKKPVNILVKAKKIIKKENTKLAAEELNYLLKGANIL